MAKRKSTTASKKTTKITKTETTTKSKGLGDTIEKITEATGIKAVVKAIAGDDCGCDNRKDKLNKLFPYTREPECLEKDEREFLSGGVLRKRVLRHEERVRIAKIHSRVFNHKYDVPCTCSPKTWMQWMKQLQDLLDATE